MAARGAAEEAADAVSEGVIQASGADRGGVVPDAVLVAANAAGVTEEARQADLLRDIFGPFPFRSVTLPPSVRTGEDGIIVKLATAAYDERELPSGHLDPQRLAVLSDALEEAGADAQLVAHLRGPGVHVRGCWAVDHLLNKE